MRTKNRNALFLAAVLALLVGSCKKSNPAKSSTKEISLFIIQASVNAYMTNDIVGQIAGDSIYLPDPPGVSLVDRTPTISFTGSAINPSSATRQDFSHPVSYTVTAADGSTVSYVVVPRPISGSKAITSFVFKAADNPGLAADLNGFISNDSIIVHADGTANLANLIPAISYTGGFAKSLYGCTAGFLKARNLYRKGAGRNLFQLCSCCKL